MHDPIHLILVCLFLVCEVLAACPIAEPYRTRLIAAGLAFYAASLLF